MLFSQVSQDDINAGGISSETTVSVDSPMGPLTVSNSSDSQSLEQVNGVDIGEQRQLFTPSILLVFGGPSFFPHTVHDQMLGRWRICPNITDPLCMAQTATL